MREDAANELEALRREHRHLRAELHRITFRSRDFNEALRIAEAALDATGGADPQEAAHA